MLRCVSKICCLTRDYWATVPVLYHYSPIPPGLPTSRITDNYNRNDNIHSKNPNAFYYAFCPPASILVTSCISASYYISLCRGLNRIPTDSLSPNGWSILGVSQLFNWITSSWSKSSSCGVPCEWGCRSWSVDHTSRFCMMPISQFHDRGPTPHFWLSFPYLGGATIMGLHLQGSGVTTGVTLSSTLTNFSLSHISDIFDFTTA